MLYFLHGLGDNERSLVNMAAWNLVEDLRRQRKIGEFLIVTPDGGRSFYVNSRDGRVLYSDFFIREFIPAIEHRYHVRAGRSARALTGISMGGYGALRFAFAYPQLFVSVTAHSAALMPELSRGIEAAAKAGFPQTMMLAEIFGNPIDATSWQANNPEALVKRNAAAIRGLRIYFDCGYPFGKTIFQVA